MLRHHGVGVIELANAFRMQAQWGQDVQEFVDANVFDLVQHQVVSKIGQEIGGRVAVL